MEFRFYRELKHNYLILDAGENDIDDYQYKMLLNNKIGGILPFDIRTMDNKCSIYYEIDLKQSITNKYMQNKMTYEDLLRLLQDYIKVCKNLGEYFLDDTCLVINEDCIFEELSTGSFFFLYKIGGDECSKTLGSILMDYVDSEDQAAAKLVYSIYDMSDEILSYHMIEELLNKENLSEDDDYGMNNEKVTSEKTKQEKTHSSLKMCEYEEDSEGESDSEENDDCANMSQNERKSRKLTLSSRFLFIMGGLFLIVAAALIYIRLFYYLNYEEGLIDLATFMVSLMMSLICIIQGFRKKKHDKILEDNYIDDEDEYYEKTDGEETVLLNFDFGKPQRKLIGLKNMDGTVICLDDNPIVIGKKSAGADLDLKDPTVSRKHAMIIRNEKDGEFVINDMGSKNGTFINGKRLPKNKRITLNLNDNITIGKCCFAYR